MKRNISMMVLFIILFSFLQATESDDFKFIIGLYKDKNYDLAKTELEAFLNKYPQSVYLNDMKYFLAGIYFNNADYSKSLKMYEVLYTDYQNPKFRGDIILNYAQSYYFLGKTDKAEALFSEFVLGIPNHNSQWKAEYFLSKIAYERHDYKKSLNFIESSLTRQNEPGSLALKVAILIAEDKTAEARSAIQKLTTDFPQDENTQQTTLLFYQHLLKKGELQEILETKGLKYNSDSPYYKTYMEVMTTAAYEKGEYEKTIFYSDKADSERAHYYSALASINLGKREEATSSLQKLMDTAKEKDIKATSGFYLAKMIADNDKNKAKNLLTEFIKNNPDNELIPEAYYQIGLIEFSLNKFEGSIKNLNLALSQGIKNDFEEKAHFLIAESTYRSGNRELAEKLFKDYQKGYPNGKFQAESYSDLGLITYEKKDYSGALIYFKKITNEYPDFDKKWIAHSYTGDIYLESGEIQLAENEYRKALEGNSEKDVIYIKLAQVYLNNKNYEKSHEELDKVNDASKSVYLKYLLQGNVFFAQKNYNSSLTSYQKAEKFAETEKSIEESLNKQAWVYYQMKQYTDAYSIYKRLANTTGNPDYYLYMSATAAFNAEKYSDAVNFFLEYISKYPDKSKYYESVLGLADSYYNMGNHTNALEKYKSIITDNTPEHILINAINGLEWSAGLIDGYRFDVLINELVGKLKNNKIKTELLNRKINYFMLKKDWEQTIRSIEEMMTINQSFKSNVDLNLTLAYAYYQNKQNDEAERIYSELAKVSSEAKVYQEWSKFAMFRGNKTEAINKLRKATENSKNQDIWLELLTLEEAEKDIKFDSDYSKYMLFAEGVNKERAIILQINRLIEYRQYMQAENLINEIADSDHEFIKANYQYYKGYLLYHQGRTDEAIPELLRVRYLYPNVNDVKNRAEAIACLAYLKTDKKDKAVQLFETIKNEIDKPTRAMIEQALGVNQ